MASFVWPTNGNFSSVSPSGLINVYDVLELTYTSTWSALNITAFCQTGTNTGSSSYRIWNAPGNPLIANGGYRLGTINDIIGKLDSYPVWCSVKLTRYGNNDDAQGGDNFRVISSANLQPATYRSTSTSSTSVASSTSTATTVSSTSSQVQTSSTSMASSQTATRSSSSSQNSATPSSSTQASTTSPGLSTGAKAGIAIGAVAAVALILVLCFLLFRSRKRERKLASPLKNDQVINTTHVPEDHHPVHELHPNDIKHLPTQDMRPAELQGSMLPSKQR